MGIYVPNQRWACAPCWHRAQGKIHIYEHEQDSEHALPPLQTKKPDDLDRYIAQRKEKDAEFAAAYDSEQTEAAQFLFCKS